MWQRPLSRTLSRTLTPNTLVRRRSHDALMRLRILPRATVFAALCLGQRATAFAAGHASSTITTATTATTTTTTANLTSDCHAILRAAVQAVNPVQAIQRHVRVEFDELIVMDGSSSNRKPSVYDLTGYDRIVVIAFGKASSSMAATLAEQLDSVKDKVSGIVITKDGHATADEQEILKRYHLKLYEAAHPVPDERSVEASEHILQYLQATASENTLVLTCISGGGSALCCAPVPPLTLGDLQATNKALLAAGWSIDAMNVLRKRLDRVKGGRLAAAAAYPSTMVSLILSDVVGDPLDLIASGPTVPDTSSWETAQKLVQQSSSVLQLPPAVTKLLQDGVDGKVPDSPPPTHPAFEASQTVLVGNTALAVQAAAVQAEKLGYHPVVLATQLQGEAKELANIFIGMAQQLSQPVAPFGLTLPAAIFTGGESTVTFETSGKGGRNQEMGLAVALGLDKSNISAPVVFASIGTDGTDGPTDAAGALVDEHTVAALGRAEARSALQQHDAYPYLDQTLPDGTSPLIKTGPTGTNVADVQVLLIGKPAHNMVEKSDDGL